MHTTRRDFLLLATGTLAAAGTGLSPMFAADKAPAKAASKRLLIFGGTGFIGPALVEVARARGWTVTLFNRGKTRPELFPDLEKLRGDRDPDKDGGLKALEGREFDAVIDDTGYYPRMVKASAELLAPRVKHYVYVSSVSAYASHEKENEDEAAPVGKIDDPTVETMGEGFKNYGPLKALCEQAVQQALPGRATVVRPGYIVGPGDPTDRFTYWPVRVAKGGEVLAPGAPSDPIQVIDVRDLAEFMVELVDRGTMGVFNAVGPERRLTMGEVLEASRKAGGTDVRFTWVTPEFIIKTPLEVSTPIWAPYADDSRGFHTRSNARAIKAGLKFRPIQATVKDTLEWFRTLPAERQEKLRAGMTLEREADVLADWHKNWSGGRKPEGASATTETAGKK